MATLACWQATIVDNDGVILPGASVEVRLESSGALATLFSDRDGSASLANPFTVGSDGLARFFVTGGAYRITATSGSFSQSWRYVGVGRASETDQLAAGIAYAFDSGTSDADPGSGEFRFNNATPSSATTMYISTTAADVGAVTTWLDGWDDLGASTDRGRLIIMSSSGDAMLLATVTGSITTATGYRKVSITPIATTGTFTAGGKVTVMFIPTGATGATGAAGTPGTTSVGKQSIWVPAAAMSPGSPSSGTLNVGGAIFPYLAFDAAADEFAFFTIASPKSWDAGTLTFEAFWTHPATATNFAVVWSVGIAAFADNVAFANSYVSANVTDTGGTTSNIYRSAESGTINPGNTQAKQDLLACYAARVGSSGSDTLAVDAYLIGIMLHYTTDAATDA